MKQQTTTKREKETYRNTLVSFYSKEQIREHLEMVYMAYIGTEAYDEMPKAREWSYMAFTTVLNSIDEIFDHHKAE